MRGGCSNSLVLIVCRGVESESVSELRSQRVSYFWPESECESESELELESESESE